MDTPDAVSQTAGAQTAHSWSPDVLQQGLRRGRAGKWRPDVLHMGPRRGPRKRAKSAQKILHAVLRRGSEEHSVPKEKRATTKRPIWEKRVLVVGAPFYGRSFWVVGAPGLPSSLLVWVLPGSRSCFLFSLYFHCIGAEKSFRCPQLFVSCACIPLVSRVCCGNACLLSTGKSVSRCGFVRRPQCRPALTQFDATDLCLWSDSRA